MILYYNKAFLRLLFAGSGSVFYRRSSIVPGLLLSVLTLIFQAVHDSGAYRFEIPNNWSMGALGASVTFAVVFRTQNGWQRYWEAVAQLHFMYSKMSDCFCQFHAFSVNSIKAYEKKGDNASLEKAEHLWTHIHTVEHSFILLSAFAAHRLSHGDNQRMEQRSKLRVGWAEQVTTRAGLRAQPDLSGASKGPKFDVLADATASIEEARNDWDASFVGKHHLTNEEDQELTNARDRVNFSMYRILRLMSGVAGDLLTPPPIQSRMYQELSNSMLGFSNALKIADVPFPLPFAQILALLLVMWSAVVPIYVVNFTQHMLLGPLLTFLIFEAVWCLNEVAKELENPFGSDANDISLTDFHARFVDVLQDLTNEEMREIRKINKPRQAGDPAVQQASAPEVSVPVPKAQAPVGSSSVAPTEDSKLALTTSTKGGHVEVIDQRLAQITERMEQHLVKIAEELKRTTSIRDKFRDSDFADQGSITESINQVTVEVTKEEALEVMRRRNEASGRGPGASPNGKVSAARSPPLKDPSSPITRV